MIQETAPDPSSSAAQTDDAGSILGVPTRVDGPSASQRVQLSFASVPSIFRLLSLPSLETTRSDGNFRRAADALVLAASAFMEPFTGVRSNTAVGHKRGRKTEALTRSAVVVGISGLCLIGTLTGCGGSSKKTTPTTAAPTASRATVRTSTTIGGSASVSRSTSVAPSATSPAPGSSTTTVLPASGSVQNLVASAAVREELLTTFTTFRADAANTPGDAAFAPSAVGGISPGSLFYAFDPSSSTYWARASFYPTVAGGPHVCVCRLPGWRGRPRLHATVRQCMGGQVCRSVL